MEYNGRPFKSVECTLRSRWAALWYGQAANFIHLNRATSLRPLFSVVVTVMSSEICKRAADSSLCTGDGEEWLEEY